MRYLNELASRDGETLGSKGGLSLWSHLQPVDAVEFVNGLADFWEAIEGSTLVLHGGADGMSCITIKWLSKWEVEDLAADGEAVDPTASRLRVSETDLPLAL